MATDLGTALGFEVQKGSLLGPSYQSIRKRSCCYRHTTNQQIIINIYCRFIFNLICGDVNNSIYAAGAMPAEIE